MGMIGMYYAFEQNVIDQIAEGTVELDDLFPFTGPELDIDKTWQVIQFIVCQQAFDGTGPSRYVVPMINEQHLNFGDYAAFYLHADQVKQAAQVIADWQPEQLRERCDVKAMLEDAVYPLMEEEDTEELLNYITPHFQALQTFYQERAAADQGLVFAIV